MEKMIKQPLLMNGDIMHHRFFPKVNHFDYKSTYISFPLSKIKDLNNAVFSLNGFNLFGLYEKNYASKGKIPINDWIYGILKKNGINNIKEVALVTHPMVLGYVFNPVTFWLCVDDKNQLIAVLSEVTNTAKQKHSYLCFNEDLSAIKSSDWIEAKKEFYVSPFMEIEGKYKFRFEYQENQMNFFINYIVDDKLKLSTSLKCHFRKFNNLNLILSFIKIPFVTFKTIFLIHYQAIKLYFKKIKYYKYPKELKNNLTISNNGRKDSTVSK